MEKEQFEPFSEDDKAKEIMKQEGLEERSKAEQNAFGAGRKRGHEEVLGRIKEKVEGLKRNMPEAINYHEVEFMDEYIRNEIGIDKYFERLKDMAINCGLSKKTTEALLKQRAVYTSNESLYAINSGADKETLLELAEKLPKINAYVVNARQNPASASEDIIEKIRERFPEAEIKIVEF